jgi:polygalacturonase
MSSRAFRKRRHNNDFEQYVAFRKAKADARKKGGFTSDAALYDAVAKAQLANSKPLNVQEFGATDDGDTDNSDVVQATMEHVHGPNCHHGE